VRALRRLKHSLRKALLLCDVPLASAAFLAAIVLKAYRNLGAWNFPLTTATLKRIGIFPIRDHFYEPLFNYSTRQRIFTSREIPSGIDFRISDQLDLLRQLNFQKELLSLPEHLTLSGGFYYDNPSYSHGDADIWYSTIRHRKPHLIIEIGSGFSTAMAREAIAKNI